jgi:hypothetical protein
MFRMKAASAAVLAAFLAVGLTTAPPAEAGSLVNVKVGDITTGDILSNNNVEINVAANIATNVCGNQVQVAALSLALQKYGWFRCENTTTRRFVRVAKAY